MFLTGYEKLTVQQDFELRKTIRNAGGKYKVIKNNIAEKAAEETTSADLIKNLAGMTSMAYTSGDPVALAKALTVYAKGESHFQVQGRYGGRPRDRYRFDQRPGEHAVQGRNLCEAAVADQCSGPAPRDRDPTASAATLRWLWIRASKKTSLGPDGPVASD